MMQKAGGGSSAAALQLQKELKELVNDRLNDYCKVILEQDNIFDWSVFIVGPQGTEYESGVFKCKLEFPTNYPFAPPAMHFVSDFWHPNVYKDGKRVETVIVSVISMLSDPNFSSPANVDASVELRKDPESYKARVKKLVEKSKRELPPGFEMPKAKAPVKLQESVSDLLSEDEFDDYNEENDDLAEDEDVDEDGEEEEEEEDDK